MYRGEGDVQSFIKAFQREGDGSWRCVAPATWDGPPRVQVNPGMQFRPGNPFMGVDLAALLEQQHRKDQQRR